MEVTIAPGFPFVVHSRPFSDGWLMVSWGKSNPISILPNSSTRPMIIGCSDSEERPDQWLSINALQWWG
jgi:hypothetical protein